MAHAVLELGGGEPALGVLLHEVAPGPDDHRRVPAVLAHLERAEPTQAG